MVARNATDILLEYGLDSEGNIIPTPDQKKTVLLSPKSIEVIGKLVAWKLTDIAHFFADEADPKFIAELETIEKELGLS